MLLRFKGFNKERNCIFKPEHAESTNRKPSCFVIIGRLRQVEEQLPGSSPFLDDAIQNPLFIRKVARLSKPKNKCSCLVPILCTCERVETLSDAHGKNAWAQRNPGNQRLLHRRSGPTSSDRI